MAGEAARLNSSTMHRLDADLYVPRAGSLSSQLRRVDAELYRLSRPSAEVILPQDVRDHWFREWRQRVGYGPKGDFDNSILCTARLGKGQGKSAFAQDAAFNCDRRFAPEWRSKITWDPAAFVDLINSQSRGEWVIYDDAGDSMLKAEFMTSAARHLTKALIVARDGHVTAVLCIPTVGLFNSAVMNSLVDYWVRIEHRGLAKIHPRPEERYTKAKGIGWYPDPQWNPYTWDPPASWPPERLAIWREYRRVRKTLRRSSLDSYADGIREARAFACEVCGRTFDRGDNHRRHLMSAAHQKRVAKLQAAKKTD